MPPININTNIDVPTTIASFGNALYAVNARFTTPPAPTTTYNIVRPYDGSKLEQDIGVKTNAIRPRT